MITVSKWIWKPYCTEMYGTVHNRREEKPQNILMVSLFGLSRYTGTCRNPIYIANPPSLLSSFLPFSPSSVLSASFPPWSQPTYLPLFLPPSLPPPLFPPFFLFRRSPHRVCWWGPVEIIRLGSSDPWVCNFFFSTSPHQQTTIRLRSSSLLSPSIFSPSLFASSTIPNRPNQPKINPPKRVFAPPRSLQGATFLLKFPCLIINKLQHYVRFMV